MHQNSQVSSLENIQPFYHEFSLNQDAEQFDNNLSHKLHHEPNFAQNADSPVDKSRGLVDPERIENKQKHLI